VLALRRESFLDDDPFVIVSTRHRQFNQLGEQGILKIAVGFTALSTTPIEDAGPGRHHARSVHHDASKVTGSLVSIVEYEVRLTTRGSTLRL
jgi:hypothetical protein